MDVQEVGESGQRTRSDDDDDDVSTRHAEDAEDSDDDDDDDRVVPEAWRSKPFRLTVMAAVVILMAGIGFGVGKLTGVGNNVVRSDIPKPETTADPFIEGSGSIADNSHANILSTTAPGMVHILSGGKSVGIGLVLTESGRVLTTYQPGQGRAEPVGGVRPVRCDLQGHGDRDGSGGGPGAASDGGPSGVAVRDGRGRELGPARS